MDSSDNSAKDQELFAKILHHEDYQHHTTQPQPGYHRPPTPKGKNIHPEVLSIEGWYNHDTKESKTLHEIGVELGFIKPFTDIADFIYGESTPNVSIVQKYFETRGIDLPAEVVTHLGIRVNEYKNNLIVVVPMKNTGGELIQIQRIFIDKNTYKKIDKRFSGSATEDRGLLIKRSKKTVTVFEGIEDLLTYFLYAKDDSSLFCCFGTVGFSKMGSFIKKYDAAVLVLDPDSKGQSEKAAIQLGDSVQRKIPTLGAGIDANRAWVDGKFNEWMKSLKDVPAPALPPQEKTKPAGLSSFLLNGNSQTMKGTMADEQYIMGKLAILGQSTVFYSAPNVGKTLLAIWLLIEKMKDGALNGDDVFYINADDSYRGLVFKLELAEKNGFGMLAPGHNGFKAETLTVFLKQMADTDTANGKIVILDTLKKFLDIMHKTKSAIFGQVVREFISKGGSLVALAHTNKNRDPNGRVIYSGTSDIVDDFDCAYLMDVVDDGSGCRTVTFENIKSRGDVSREAGYSYTLQEGQTYPELLDSVQPVDKEKQQRAKEKREIDQKLERNAVLIETITDLIQEGVNLKTELIAEAFKRSGESRKKTANILKEHTGNSFSSGHRWHILKGEKSEKKYQLLSATVSELIKKQNES